MQTAGLRALSMDGRPEVSGMADTNTTTSKLTESRCSVACGSATNGIAPLPTDGK